LDIVITNVLVRRDEARSEETKRNETRNEVTKDIIVYINVNIFFYVQLRALKKDKQVHIYYDRSQGWLKGTATKARL